MNRLENIEKELVNLRQDIIRLQQLIINVNQIKVNDPFNVTSISYQNPPNYPLGVR